MLSLHPQQHLVDQAGGLGAHWSLCVLSGRCPAGTPGAIRALSWGGPWIRPCAQPSWGGGSTDPAASRSPCEATRIATRDLPRRTRWGGQERRLNQSGTCSGKQELGRAQVRGLTRPGRSGWWRTVPWSRGTSGRLHATTHVPLTCRVSGLSVDRPQDHL